MASSEYDSLRTMEHAALITTIISCQRVECVVTDLNVL